MLVGSFANPDNVRRLIERLSATGLPYFTETTGAGLTSVRVGPYTTRADAKRAVATLGQANLPGILSTR